MKFKLLFIIFLTFTQIRSLSNCKNKRLKKSFEIMAKVFTQHNHVVTVVISKSDEINSYCFASIVAVPHVVTRFDSKKSEWTLNSSAIVLLDSVASLKTFNQLTVLPWTFALSQQIFIFFREGTYEELAKIPVVRAKTPIVQYEYFLV